MESEETSTYRFFGGMIMREELDPREPFDVDWEDYGDYLDGLPDDYLEDEPEDEYGYDHPYYEYDDPDDYWADERYL